MVLGQGARGKSWEKGCSGTKATLFSEWPGGGGCRVAGSVPEAASCGVSAGRKPPGKHRPMCPPHAGLTFPSALPWFILTRLFPPCRGDTPLRTQRSPAHPGDQGSLWKTQSIAARPAQRAVNQGLPVGPPPRRPGSACGRGRQQEVRTASSEWKLQASRPSRKGLQVGGGAPGSQVWTPASSSAERRRQGWEIRTGALYVNQGPIWDEEAHQSPQQAQFQTKSRLLNRQEEDPNAARPLRDGA